jgi:hypothetical protein
MTWHTGWLHLNEEYSTFFPVDDFRIAIVENQTVAMIQDQIEPEELS